MKMYPINLRGERRWCVDFQTDGRRKRIYFLKKSDAEAKLIELKEQKKVAGEVWITIPPEDRAVLVEIWNSAKAQGRSIRDIWNASPAKVSSISLGDAVKSTIQSKEQSGRRSVYVTNLKVFFGMFSRGRESMQISDITVDMIREFLSQFKNSEYRKTALNRISTLFSNAVRQGWIISNPCDRVERITVEIKPPAILTINQIRTCLDFTRKNHPKFIAWLALGLFAGLRPSEADRMTWDKIDLNKEEIDVSAENKTRRRRIIKMLPNCVAWLRLHQGEIVHQHNTRVMWIRSLRTELRMKEWPQDVLRHTAASYLVRHFESAEKTALYLGNSVDILHQRYRNLVTDEDCKLWLNMNP